MDAPALTVRRTQAQGPGDFFDTQANAGAIVQVLGARLVAGSGAAATAQITDQDGTVLYDLAAVQGSSDESVIPVRAVRKVALAAISGAGAAVTVYIA